MLTWLRGLGLSVSLLTCWPAGPGHAKPTDSFEPPVESGKLLELVRGVVRTMPGQDSHAFVQPKKGEIDRFAAAVRLVQAGELAAAAAELATFDYDLISFHDQATGGQHLVVRERVPCQRCWGLLIMNRSSGARNVLVEVPHPLWDRRTPELGAEAYVELDAAALIMAGAHRYANGPQSPVSDMARNKRSVFQGLHVALSDPGTQTLQYHGFSLDNNPGYPNVVLSNGTASPQPELYRFEQELEARGESAGVYDGRQWAALGGTGNPQARYTRSIGGRFYHLEHETWLRNDPDRRAAAVAAARAALFPPAPEP